MSRKLKVKGLVEDFKWNPEEKILVSEQGDVEIVGKDVKGKPIKSTKGKKYPMILSNSKYIYIYPSRWWFFWNPFPVCVEKKLLKKFL